MRSRLSPKRAAPLHAFNNGTQAATTPVDSTSVNRPCPVKVKRKISPIAGISLAFRPRRLSRMCLDRPHHSLGSWAWAREVGGFSRSGCHRLWARMPIQFRNQQAERRSSGDHGSIWDSWPIAFSGYPRGPRVFHETRCPRHTASRALPETRSRTKVSREPDGIAREDSRHGADSIRDTQAVCGFR